MEHEEALESPRGLDQRPSSVAALNVEIGLAQTSSAQETAISVQEPPVRRQDRTYDRFRTRPSRFQSWQVSSRRGAASIRHGTGMSRNRRSESHVDDAQQDDDDEARLSLLPDRFFDALDGPELENLKEHEKELMLPRDERWPFLLRFPVSCFGVCMGLGSQVILWKNLSSSTQLHFLHIPLQINLTLWCLALFVLILIFLTYSLKIIFFYEAVRREFHHPVRVNFFFAPWIACMFLALGLPSAISQSSVHPAVWCIFMAPVFALELRIYGQWLSGSARRLSKVANACTHLSVVGNFVGALLGANVGWIEPAIFFWAVGLAHYLVLFVTLYQHLPSDISLPKDLHPVFFLFVAAPSTASVAWMHITGRFDLVSRLVFFMALFLYSSLVVRINFFRGIRFSISWWAYTFPMTAAAIASVQYTTAANSWITQGLAIILSVTASIIVFILFCSTILHAIVWRSLFPNDLAIAITMKKSNTENSEGRGNMDNADELLNDSQKTHKQCEQPLHETRIKEFNNIISKDQNCQSHYSSEDQLQVDYTIMCIPNINFTSRTQTC